MATTSKKQTEQARDLLAHILELMAVEGTVAGEDTDDTLRLVVSSASPAFIIGHHGKTLTALQTVLGAIAYRRFGKVHVVVDVEGWRERREQTVAQLATAAAARAKETGFPQPIYNLTPFERRVVHLALAQDGDVQTQSQGEGRERFLVVKPKSK